MGVHRAPSRSQGQGRWARLTSYAALVCLSVPGMITMAATPAAAEVSATLSGGQEVPPDAATGAGSGTVTLNPTETQITVDLSWTDLTGAPIGVHIHGAATPGVNAFILFDFIAIAPKTTTGMFTGQVVAVTPAQVAELKAGQWYFNIHAAVRPGGELRGQIGGSSAASSAQLFVATLRGSQEVPQKPAVATGRGLVTLNQAQTDITFNLSGASQHGMAAAGGPGHG